MIGQLAEHLLKLRVSGASRNEAAAWMGITPQLAGRLTDRAADRFEVERAAVIRTRGDVSALYRRYGVTSRDLSAVLARHDSWSRPVPAVTPTAVLLAGERLEQRRAQAAESDRRMAAGLRAAVAAERARQSLVRRSVESPDWRAITGSVTVR